MKKWNCLFYEINTVIRQTYETGESDLIIFNQIEH